MVARILRFMTPNSIIRGKRAVNISLLHGSTLLNPRLSSLLFPMAIRRASSRQSRYASKSLAPLSLSSSCMEHVRSEDTTTMRKAQKLGKRRGAIGELRWSLSLLATCLDKISIMTAFARELPPLLLFSTIASWASETRWTSSRARRWYSPLLS